MIEKWQSRIDRVLPDVVALRRELHAHPEMSRKEHQTSERIRNALKGLRGLEVLPPLMGTDVVAILNGGREGPCIALRADMDALPIVEQTGVGYQSSTPGVMHACGHDGHMATLVGAARVLSEAGGSLGGKVKFIFQPDEEDTGGGGVLCERGVLDAPKVDGIFALHAWPTEPVGVIALRSGSVMAASTTFSIVVRGRGGHGAYPHRTIDPIVAAAHIVTGLQSIVSRTVDPLDAAVVTIGRIAAGTADNIIPEECHLTGTMRYLRAETGEHLRERLRRLVQDTAGAHGAEAEVQLVSGYPQMTNDPELTDMVAGVASDLLGAERVRTDIPPSMGVEDFAYYAQQVPAVMFRLGVRPVDQATYPHLHSPHFNFNDDALPVGIAMFCEITERFLARKQ